MIVYFLKHESEDSILLLYAFTEAIGMWPSGVRECMRSFSECQPRYIFMYFTSMNVV